MIKSKFLRVADLVVSLLLLAYGIYAVATDWPAPGGWSILWLALGVAGCLAWFLNPMKRMEEYLARRLVKTRA